MAAAAVNAAATHHSPLWSPGRGPAGPRLLVINQGMLHIIGIPLLILGCLGVGFVIVYLKEVLLPFVVSVFIVYLLRPLVNVLTTPFGRICPCCTAAHTRAHTQGRGRGTGYTRLSTAASDSSLSDTASNVHGITSAQGPLARRGRAPSPPKYPRAHTHAFRAVLSRVQAAAATQAAACSAGWMQGSSSGSTGASGQPASGSSGSNTAPTGAHTHTHTHAQSAAEECGCCCGWFRITRCPRWFAILVSLTVAGALLSGLVLLIADAVLRFQESSLRVYLDEASRIGQALQRWFLVFGVQLDAGAIVNAIKEQIALIPAVQAALVIAVDGVGNALLVMLLVLYLLAEQSNHAPNSLRARVDNQIQRYVVIKTAISAAQGLVVFIIMGYVLNVRMSHLFGVLHFLLNYIPTAGPIIATVLPLPIVVLDPHLSVAAKITAFVAPTAVHMVVGNFVEPLVFGTSLELHPVTVLLALAVWYALWGIAGAILAVPITAVMRIILAALDHPYAIIIIALLEGRLSAATAEFDNAFESSSIMEDVEMGSRTRSAGTASEIGLHSAMKDPLVASHTSPEPADLAAMPAHEMTPPKGAIAPNASKRNLLPQRAVMDASSDEDVASALPSGRSIAPTGTQSPITAAGAAVPRDASSRDRDAVGFASTAGTRRRASPPVTTNVEPAPSAAVMSSAPHVPASDAAPPAQEAAPSRTGARLRP